MALKMLSRNFIPSQDGKPLEYITPTLKEKKSDILKNYNFFSNPSKI